MYISIWGSINDGNISTIADIQSQGEELEERPKSVIKAAWPWYFWNNNGDILAQT
jgi:hypothetical protein